jgi:hypothetical protein
MYVTMHYRDSNIAKLFLAMTSLSNQKFILGRATSRLFFFEKNQ